MNPETPNEPLDFIKKRFYDLVDNNDSIVTTGTKEDARNLRLFTRSVHILLENQKGQILICKRPYRKKSYGGQITSSAGGHVEQNETYEKAAKRELKEELKIDPRLIDAGRFDVISKKERTLHRLFIGRISDENNIDVDASEISSYWFARPLDIQEDLREHPRKYAKPFHQALAKYLGRRKLAEFS